LNFINFWTIILNRFLRLWRLQSLAQNSIFSLRNIFTKKKKLKINFFEVLVKETKKPNLSNCLLGKIFYMANICFSYRHNGFYATLALFSTFVMDFIWKFQLASFLQVFQYSYNFCIEYNVFGKYQYFDWTCGTNW